MRHHLPVIVDFPSPAGSSQKPQQIVGKVSTTCNDVEEFRGIPYATIPGRWRHSLLRDRLPVDVFDASMNGPRCSQPSDPNNTDFFQAHLDFPSDVKNSEFDCLNLFIVRPRRAALVKAGLEGQIDSLPVYVYIHGGGYFFGAGTDPMWNPARLVARSIALKKPFIAVNINYRLNIFGFAASSDIIQAQSDSARGCNFGLGDQRTAIEWVSRNIASFGGDPGKITVGGQSAGASSAHAHVLDARNSSDRPLLRRAIIQSGAGGTLGPCPMPECEEQWNFLCRHFGVTGSSPEQRLTRLSTVPAEELLEAVRQAGWYVFPVADDGLTVHRENDGRWNVSLKLNNHTEEFTNGSVSTKPIDVLIGDTDVESSVYSVNLTSFEQLANAVQNCSASEAAKVEIMQAYGLDHEATVDILRNRIFSLLGDERFGEPVEQAFTDFSASSNSNQSPGTVWPTRSVPYRIQYGNPFPGPCFGVAQHCVDIIYVYDCFHNDLRSVDRIEQSATATGCDANSSLVEQMQSDWIHFITAEGDQGGTVFEDCTKGSLIVYGRDRRKRIVQLSQDEEYLARRKRFEVLRRHGKEVAKITKALKAI